MLSVNDFVWADLRYKKFLLSSGLQYTVANLLFCSMFFNAVLRISIIEFYAWLPVSSAIKPKSSFHSTIRIDPLLKNLFLFTAQWKSRFTNSNLKSYETCIYIFLKIKVSWCPIVAWSWSWSCLEPYLYHWVLHLISLKHNSVEKMQFAVA